MRVLIAPDKFKGTLTARQAAAAMARGWRRGRPGDELISLPVSDGGDGFGEVLAAFSCAKLVRTVSTDAAGRRHIVPWWWDPASRTAIIESARVIGLAMLPPAKFHPFDLDTRGLAKVIQAAARRGARRCVVGIGGSATNDGGFGLAVGLGWKFTDRHGNPLLKWTDLTHLSRIDPPRQFLLPRQITVAVDVHNLLLGVKGCTRVYGPQKGLKPADYHLTEACLRRLAKVVHKQTGAAAESLPGSGAAGGLGFGLVSFAGARLESGFALVARESELNRHLRRVDVVITGEGRMDRSSLMGKGAGELARCCNRLGKTCIALAGEVSDRAGLQRRFLGLGALTDLTSAGQARAKAAFWLEKLAAGMARRVESWGDTRRDEPGKSPQNRRFH